VLRHPCVANSARLECVDMELGNTHIRYPLSGLVLYTVGKYSNGAADLLLRDALLDC
jgi:hypothetical protein